MRFYQIRPFINWSLMLAAIAGVIYIGYLQSNHSNIMRIATGERGSYLYSVGNDLKQAIEKYSDYKVELIVSKDSAFNRGSVQGGGADVAILSPAVADMTNLVVIAPIAKNYIHVVVKIDSNIGSINELAGHKVSLGSLESDHRINALKLLEHYRVEEKTLRNNQVSHLELLEGRDLDGAIITSSTNDAYLLKLMSSGNFKLLDTRASEALASTSLYLASELLPVGMYPSVMGPLPQDWINIVTTDSIIVTRADADNAMVQTVIQTLLTKEMTEKYPLVSEWVKKTGGQWPSLETHQAAKHVYNPYGAVKADILDTLLKVWNYKWIMLCIVVFLYGAKSRWKDYKQARMVTVENNRLQRIQKLIEDINQLEQQQADTKDYRLLMRRLAEARKIKQGGIIVATEHCMSNSQIFMAFLQQCDHVIRDIQWKLSIGLSDAAQVA
jgi:TRAP transporter TAXI family solute receptor